MRQEANAADGALGRGNVAKCALHNDKCGGCILNSGTYQYGT